MVKAPEIPAYERDTHGFSSLGGYTQDGFELCSTADGTSLPGTTHSECSLDYLFQQLFRGRIQSMPVICLYPNRMSRFCLVATAFLLIGVTVETWAVASPPDRSGESRRPKPRLNCHNARIVGDTSL